LLLRGKKELNGKEDESVRVRITFAQEGEEKKNETKISRTLVREGICRRSESLFL